MIVFLLYLHAFFTLFMTGLIWFVQLVHYPLFRDVGMQQFPHYEKRHCQNTGLLVGLPMMAELLLAGFIVYRVGGILPWIGVILLFGIWACTAIWQIPAHQKLEQGFDENTWKSLVRTNWIRTILWTCRGGLSLVFLEKIAHFPS